MNYIRIVNGMVEHPVTSDLRKLREGGFLPVIEGQQPEVGDHERLAADYVLRATPAGTQYDMHTYRVVPDTAQYEREITEAKRLLSESDYRVIRAMERIICAENADTAAEMSDRIEARRRINEIEEILNQLKTE